MDVDCLALKDLNTKKLRLELPENEGRNAQKENRFFDLSRVTPKTPMKNETMPIDLSRQKGCTPERNPVTPNPSAEVTPSDPWTPTANLKMLISAASPDIRDREKKKELFRPIENDRKEDCLCDAFQFDDSATDDFEKQRPSRKQKSLGLLCQKFLARYPSHPLSTEKTTISLDEVASSLSVERRRIYDIVNVLESLHLVSRVAKNQYCWHGLQNLDQTLEILQRQGQEQKYEEQMVYMQQKDTDAEMKSGDSKKKDSVLDSQYKEFDISDSDFTSVSNSRKDKSLRIMSQKFVMLFLVSKTKTVTLDIAAKILIEEGQDAADHSKFKTKVRRLYDIANVLTSLELIKKVHVTEERGRKPAFKWIGPANFKNSSHTPWAVVPTSTVPTSKQLTETQPTLNGKKRLSRHTSFNILQTPDGDTRRVNSAPSSPQRDLKAWTTDSGNYSKKMVHLAAVSRLQFDDDDDDDETTKPVGTQKTNSSVENGLTSPSAHFVAGNSISNSCVKTLPHSYLPLHRLDVTPIFLPNGANGHVAVLPPSGVSKTEEGQPALLDGQHVYFSPTSVVMLCRNMQSSTGEEAYVQRSENKIHQEQADLPTEQQNMHSLSICELKKQTADKMSSPLPQEEEPAAKRIKGSLTESSIAVEQSKVTFTQAECLNKEGCTSPAHLDRESWHKLDAELLCVEEDFGKDTSPATANELKKADLQSERNEHPVLGEQLSQGNSEQLSLAQYFYLPSAAGLNGLNLLLPSNQNHGALTVSPSRFASVSVPYVVVPSTSLAAFPVLCPTTMPSAINTASSPIPNTSSVNFSFPSLVPPAHLLIGTPVVPLKTSECSSAEQQDFSPVHLSPVLGCSPTTVKPVSPTCSSQPIVTLKRHQQSPTPLTPKSNHSPQHETFFQTPGNRSSGPVSGQKRDGRQIRTAGSVQRRLEISSSTLDYSP